MIDALEPIASEVLRHELAARARSCSLRELLVRSVLAAEHTLSQRRVDDLGDTIFTGRGNHVLLGFAKEERVLGLRRDRLREPVLAADVDTALDLLAAPVRDADEANLAGLHDLGECPEGLLQRHVLVEAV